VIRLMTYCAVPHPLVFFSEALYFFLWRGGKDKRSLHPPEPSGNLPAEWWAIPSKFIRFVFFYSLLALARKADGIMVRPSDFSLLVAVAQLPHFVADPGSGI